MTKILLVEDDKSLREIYGVRLKAEGYDIVSAGDGEEALAMAIKERPNLIVSDVMMPKISGFDMLDILRSTTETKDVKVIMMTALSSDDQRARGEALGADRYLVKSQVGIEDVVRTVHEVLADGIAPPAQTPAQMFNTPVPAPTPAPVPTAAAPVSPMADVRPAAPIAPRPVDQPVPALATPPVLAPVPEPVPTPTIEPIVNPVVAAPIAPEITQPAPSPFATPMPPASNPLPQPTAPFSSNRPGSTGADRIIQPLTNVQQPADFGSMMNQELNAQPPQQQMVPPPQPVTPPIPTLPTQDSATPYIQQ